MDMLLQILQCYAEDELYHTDEVEIEQLERMIASEQELALRQEMP